MQSLQVIMHSILWASIGASALVAVVTTLLVEYLAKPGLEARKERILDKKRSNRTALRDLRRAIFLAHNILTVRDDQGEPVLRKRTVQYAVDIERLVLDAYEYLRIPRALYKDWTDVAYEFISLAVIIQERILDGKYWEKFSAAYDKVEEYYFLAALAPWHYRKRLALIHEIESSRSIP